MEMLKDRIQPHNIEAEQAFLGAILLDSSALIDQDIIVKINPDDLYRIAHNKIYSAIIRLYNQNSPIDIISVVDELKNTNDLDSCGSPSYISDLTSLVPTTANLNYYADIIKKCSIRRNLIKVSSETIANAFDDSQEIREIIEEAEKRIFEIADNKCKKTFIPIGDVVSKSIEIIEKLYHNSESYSGIPSGFRCLDELTYGFQKAEFIVIGARPSVGKTALALSMAANMSIRNKIPLGFFTLEMTSVALVQRLICSEAKLDSKKIRKGTLKPSEFHNIIEAASKIYTAPFYIEDTPNLKLLDLRVMARRMKAQHNVAIIFIDYITLITAEIKNVPRHEQIAEISRSLKALARELNIPIIALSQVRRETEGKRPNLADIRESGSIEQDADVVLFLHRKDENKNDDVQEIELIVAKQRNGPVGVRKLTFIPKYTSYSSTEFDKEE